MSESSLPAPYDQHKPVIFISEAARVEILAHLLSLPVAKPFSTETMKRLLPQCDLPLYSEEKLRLLADCVGHGIGPTPAKPPAKPRRRRPPRTRRTRTQSSQITPYKAKRAAMEDLEIRRLRRDGFTHYFGKEKRFLMTPPEFTLVLACEPREVAQVIHEVLLQSVGYADDSGDGRREWVALSFRHFERRGILSHNAAKEALDYAVEQGYLLHRRHGLQRWEYAVHYCQSDIVPR